MIKIVEAPIDIQQVIELVRSDKAGAIDVFIGTVRSKTAEKNVVRLEYDAYDSMVIKEMQRIVDQAKEKWPVEKMAIHHRKGTLQVGEVAVVIAVSTPHRGDAFEACRFAIETLKKTTPIWKKEIYDGGEEWVSPRP